MSLLEVPGEGMERSSSASPSYGKRPISPNGRLRRIASGQSVKETLNAVFHESSDGKRTLNQYILRDMLGRGAYGTVYCGVDTSMEHHGETVAIKEFSKAKLRRQKLQREGGVFGPRGRLRGGAAIRGGRGGCRSAVPAAVTKASALAKSDNPIDLVRGEIAIFKKLNHDNLIRLYEVLDDPDQDSLYMVFEICSKGPIMEIRQDEPTTPLSEEVSRDIFRQLVLGIEYLHEHEIAHRDIKPDNILVAEDGTIKIADFGVSEMFDPSNDRLKTSAGSPAFSAPEVCIPHHGDFSARACDVWAMGVTLYCMLFGTLPFNGRSIVELYESIRSQPVTFPHPPASPEQKALLERLLEKDPTKRITIDEIRSDPWVTCNGTLPLLSKAENCIPVAPVTEEDLKTAVKGITPLFTVLKAVNKLKKLRHHSESDAIRGDKTLKSATATPALSIEGQGPPPVCLRSMSEPMQPQSQRSAISDTTQVPVGAGPAQASQTVPPKDFFSISHSPVSSPFSTPPADF
ncbi:kinase-like domain-containing protein [Phlyctochytrium arcticum]|nr:kinase-like domain-containing protein [Phlyctochytrium arcticum]